MTTIALLAALDTKADDAIYIRDRLQRHGLKVIVVDIGVLGTPHFTADITRSSVAEAGGTGLETLAQQADRSTAVDTMGRGARRLVSDLVANQSIVGVFALGGGAGTTIGSTVMKGLPLGLPKAILSTVAAGNTANYIDTSDIVLFPSIVDVSGINRISAVTYTRAADAFAGMVHGSTETAAKAPSSQPLVAASMFGVTTPAVTTAKAVLEAAGCEVLVFHATGTGGRMMERLITERYFDGVLDLTTTEWSDEVVGGILSAGPNRLSGATAHAIPQVVSLGATDMVNFGPPSSVPRAFATGRNLYLHNSENTLMRVHATEAQHIGESIGRMLRPATGPCTVLIPRKGTSALDLPGQPFDDPIARTALAEAVKSALTGSSVEIVELDYHINDTEFATEAAHRLLAQLNVPSRPTEAITHV